MISQSCSELSSPAESLRLSQSSRIGQSKCQVLVKRGALGLTAQVMDNRTSNKVLALSAVPLHLLPTYRANTAALRNRSLLLLTTVL